MHTRTCVAPGGKFVFGIHKPAYGVSNLRKNDFIRDLGKFSDGRPYQNRVNFPEKDVSVEAADWVYEIPNPLPFRGVTYISRRWAEKTANCPEKIGFSGRPAVSFHKTADDWREKGLAAEKTVPKMLAGLPEPLQLSLAVTTTDPGDLMVLANISAALVFDADNQTPVGIRYKDPGDGRILPEIYNEQLFEAVANNPHLPDEYKKVMVLKPGAQGTSPITAEWTDDRTFDSHVFEYLRENSYIPWGHFAANMADDRVRYRLEDLTVDDVRAMRHLYYQRTFSRLAGLLGIERPIRRQSLTDREMEDLRLRISAMVGQKASGEDLMPDATIWGWNFGFDFAPTGYRLHGSHQQVHQQYALSPAMVYTPAGNTIPSFSSGDMVASFIRDYEALVGSSFFDDYIAAIENNTRTDGRPGDSNLVVYQDENVMVFVPKAQTSQWELQMMTRQPLGNLLETNQAVRASLDRGIHAAVTVLGALGAEMITSIEYSKRFSSRDTDQHLLYAFLPRLPHSPGSFSEAQKRWINGHYPEDFAAACRLKKEKLGIA